jgi:hypothetical protein
MYVTLQKKLYTLYWCFSMVIQERYTTIGSDTISSCTFFLLMGDVQKVRFGFLSHHPEVYQPPLTPTETMMKMIDQILDRVRYFMDWKRSPNIKGLLSTDQIENVTKLTGGGVLQTCDLVRDGFGLLNYNNNNIPFSRCIYQQLKSNVTILKPITFPVNDSDESYGT